jgi:hypothetical protein
MLSAEPQMEQRHNNLRTTPAQCAPFGSAWALVHKRDAATAEEKKEKTDGSERRA